eukprot:SAG31_NODE_36485_length_313_cov_0.509346_1_plen_41_part_10
MQLDANTPAMIAAQRLPHYPEVIVELRSFHQVNNSHRITRL